MSVGLYWINIFSEM